MIYRQSICCAESEWKRRQNLQQKVWLPRPKCVPVVYYVTREFFFDDKTPATSDGRLFRLSDSSCCQIRFFSHQNQGANQGRNLFTTREERGEKREMENSSVLRYSTAQVKSNGHPPNAACFKQLPQIHPNVFLAIGSTCLRYPVCSFFLCGSVSAFRERWNWIQLT